MSKNQDLFEKAKKLIPGGVNSPVRALKSVGTYPRFIDWAEGPFLCDMDGNRYVDYCQSWGALIFGHAYAPIAAAVKRQVSRGSSYGCATALEVEMAELVTGAFDSIDQVRFVNSGTEAVMSALRLSRAFTGRTKIIKFEGCYHGHADCLLVKAGSGVEGLPESSSRGIPKHAIEDTIVLPYNEPTAVMDVFKTHGPEIAAVIVEPVAANMGVVAPRLDFLETIRKKTSHHGSVLIFDEVITGFRLAYGGAQELFGIQADMTCLGKIIGGGFPVGAFGGREDIMSLLAPQGDVYQAGTLSGNPVAMTAGIETLKMLKSKEIYKKLHEKGEYLQREIGSGKQLQVLGSMFTLFFRDSPVENFKDVQNCDLKKFAEFYRFLLEKGLYLSPSQFETNFIGTCHGQLELDTLIRGINEFK